MELMAEDKHDEDDTDQTRIIESETFKGRLEEASKAPPCIVVLVGPPHIQGKLWALTEPEYVVGRAIQSSVFIDDGSVSKNHAKFLVNRNDVSVMDLESTNKTVINGKVLPPFLSVRLENNDQLKIGNIILKFLGEGSIEAVSNKYNFDMRLKDALTGIYNKGGLQAQAEEAFKRAKLLGTSLSLVVFDLDFFKKVNDTYGHDAGDYVLREMSFIVQSRVIRSGDIFARYGGEEFVVLLSDTNLPRAIEIAERIRVTIQKHRFSYQNQVLPITVSLGIATKTQEMKDWDDLFREADKAAYKSKQSGRNRVTACNQ